jgi:hypothetical protein
MGTVAKGILDQISSSVLDMQIVRHYKFRSTQEGLKTFFLANLKINMKLENFPTVQSSCT